MSKNSKIDFVIMWVDGADREWLGRKKKYQNNLDVDDEVCRYRDWDNLQYLFRGIEKYTPWVNKVHLVTDHQVPSWLNLSHPKLNLIFHEDFLPEKYLPTFNSHTIELNLHRIKDLSEQFVLFNDDMFIIDYMRPDDFFKNGLPVDSAIMGLLSPSFRAPINKYIYNNVSLINDRFSKHSVIINNLSKWLSPKYGKHLFRNIMLLPWSKFSSFYNHHLPTNFLKESFKEAWEEECEVLDRTSRFKFREDTDVSQWFFRYWQLAKNNFYPDNLSKRGKMYSVQTEKDVLDIKKYILSQKGKLICINDNEKLSERDFAQFSKLINNYFDELLPNKSEFELKND